MENQSPQFRTAAFGGFQKQDVLNYLEKSAKDHADKIADLQKQLKEAMEAQVEMEAQAAADQIRVAELEDANRRLGEDLASREESLAMSIQRCDALEGQLAALKADMERMAPAAEAYRELKDRAAGIELAAHVRAQAIEEESRRKVEKTAQEVLTWIDQVQGAYSNLHLSLNAALAAAAEELRKSREKVKGLSGELVGGKELLGTLQAGEERANPLEQKAFEGVRKPGEPGSYGGMQPPIGPSPFTK